MASVTYFKFKCSICGIYISEFDPGIIIENKEDEENLLFGKIITAHIGHKSEESLHWNIVTLDQNGEYRGHKHSFKEKIRDESESYNFSIMAKYAKKFLPKIISDLISGQTILISNSDSVLILIVEKALKSFIIPNKGEKVFTNQIVIGNSNEINKIECTFDVDNKKYHRPKKLPIYKWVRVLLNRLNDIEEAAINHMINSYIGSIRKGYYELMARLGSFFSITEACPLSDPSSTIQVQLFMDNVIPTKEFEDFKSYCTKEEYEIIISLITRQFFLHYS